ncbi:MAG: amidohydrolase family protein [Bryobacterales bacterium]|nr:amidohydrolase family protein [Bryobacterales bacterium]
MKRRRWVQTAVGAGAGLALQPVRAEEIKPARVIDTHTHFYDPKRPAGVPWPPKESQLYRTVMPDDWAAVARPQGVTETVVVEASEWVEDNQWVLDLAAQDKRLIGVVGNLNPNDPGFEANVKRFAANPKFRGVRWRAGLVDLEKNPEVVLKGAGVLAEHGLELDLNGSSVMLLHASQLARKVPDLRIVINHLGGSGDPAALHPGWKEAVGLLARQCPNVFMKVSALVEQVKGPEGQAPRDLEYYLPVLDHLWTAFGEDRLIYGSDWPVSEQTGDYASVVKLTKGYFESKGRAAMEKLFQENAIQFYRIPKLD